MTIKSIEAPELKSMLDGNQDIVLIDCREQQEWDDGHIEAAKFLPLSEMEDRFGEIGGKDAKIILQCRSGKRSMRAAEFLEDQGYNDLTNLEGGILGWLDNEYSTVKG